ncbi:hypothetical protein HDU77_006937 [Chytriomyces hyalinus]|uniref:Uncharacterized protein n=1 Tax=Chytriomyces confervae TaxID=246404 RepID=A0A507FBJ7_9FUNG|nr:hypothetical protein HDU77_006937 [Chytriomyces hyalinus]KAJ3406819.1 hypothetical protein HDU80_010335 [Chytriomyces hyalinus]TPX73502.1 hypothetical protein CcCBS67573_g05243 [Chytriomyces confervae]
MSNNASESTPLLRRQHSSTTDHAHDALKAETPFSFKDFRRFIGPGFMIGVGYLDPGNWATDLAAGSQFGYSLLYIVLAATIMAMVLQYLCIKLGTVTGNDLAMACRKHFNPQANLALFILCELAIIATDLAEVVGTAIALNLLFSIPLPVGVALTSLDVLIVLMFWGAKHLKTYEKGVMALIGLVAICFVYLLGVAKPVWVDVMWGFVPSAGIVRQEGQLYIAMAIIGATIMPHNLYLHSSIVRYRSHAGEFGEIVELPPQKQILCSTEENTQPLKRMTFLPQYIRYANIDSIVALTGALLINSAILIVAGSAFSGDGEVGEIQDAYYLLKKHLGPLAAFSFALALFCAGQSSTITGTLCGQIVTEGFLGPSIKFQPAVQRLLTRVLAIVPAMAAALYGGESGMNDLLVMSQVMLSLQLPFAVWPLVWITGGAEGDAMKVTFKGNVEDGQGDESVVVDYANSNGLKRVAFAIAVVITLFQVILVYKTFY